MSLVTREHEEPRLRLVVLGHAQPVDVLEHAHAQAVERVLGGVHEPDSTRSG